MMVTDRLTLLIYVVLGLNIIVAFQKKECDKDWEFECSDGRCLDIEEVCDGERDCSNDEDHCDKKCHPELKFQCLDKSGCLDKVYVCDGDEDCDDGSDEKNCKDGTVCAAGYKACNNSHCIPAYKFCDGTKDCEDGSDEVMCTHGSCATDQGFFECKDRRKCLSPPLVCDGIHHCDDHSDENGQCEMKCNKVKCHQACSQTPDGPQCHCRSGYKLDEERCLDVNECDGSRMVCDHFCSNNDGNFTCSCGENYDLQKDGATCKSKDIGKGFLLFSVGSRIKAKYLDNSKLWLVAEDKHTEIPGVAYDPIDDNVYWISKSNKVMFKSLHNRDVPREFLKRGLLEPKTLAVDPLGRNLYIMDERLKHVLVCTLNRRRCIPIYKNLTSPNNLQLDLRSRHMYWTDSKLKTIERASMDGSNHVTFLRENISTPNGLAIDFPANRVYWLDSIGKQIGSVTLKGDNFKVLPIDDVERGQNLAVWEDRIYWSEWYHELRRNIHSCRKRDGEDIRTEFKNDKHTVHSLTIYHPSMIEHTNPCKDHPCSHICLINPSGFVCRCPDKMELDRSERNCKDTDHSRTIVGVQNRLIEVSYDEYGSAHQQVLRFPQLDLGTVSDLDYDPTRDILYIADSKHNKITSVNLSTRETRVIIDDIKEAFVISVDWLRGNLYWIDSYHHEISVINLDKLIRKIVIDRMQRPVDIAVDVTEGYLYICDAPFVASIVKCKLNGESCIPIIKSLTKPTSVFVYDALDSRSIFWTDLGNHTISSSNNLGSNINTLFYKLDSPMKMHVTRELILWTEKDSDILFTTKKNSLDTVTKIHIDVEEESVPTVVMPVIVVQKQISTMQNPCEQGTKCTEFCFTQSHDSTKVCECKKGYTPDERGYCIEHSCASNERKCDDNECILNFVWCDGTADCNDKSDEMHCRNNENCTKDGKHSCNDGTCYTDEDKCDGHFDCPDKSDEDPKECNAIECLGDFKCKSGQCVKLSQRCNGLFDCQDKSDEFNCTASECHQHEIKCDNGDCIPMSWICDGYADCPKEEDEKNCTCRSGFLKCNDGHCISLKEICLEGKKCEGIENLSYNCSVYKALHHYCPENRKPCYPGTHDEDQCIEISKWCNEETDCKNNADELSCDSQCKEHLVKCEDGTTCMRPEWRCDGEEYCPDGSDEVNCTDSNTKVSIEATTFIKYCGEYEFECPDGTCLAKEKVCDGKPDCIQEADETDECDKCAHNNGGCHHNCHNHPVKAVCSCRPGFILDTNGYSCHDLNECLDDEVCHHKCKNLKGTYECACHHGYKMSRDGITCKPMSGEHNTMAVIYNGGFMYLDEDLATLGRAKSLPEISPAKSHFKYDPTSKGLIGIEEASVKLLTFSKGEWKSKPLKIPQFSASSYDYLNRNIYLAVPNFFVRGRDAGEERIFLGTNIRVHNLNRGTSGHLISLQNKTIRGLEISVPSDGMITCDCADYCTKDTIKDVQLVKRNMKGEYSQILAKEKILSCDYIAIDEIKRRIYWLDSILNKIESVDMHGQTRKMFITDQLHAGRSLTVLNHHLIWFNTEYQDMVKCSIKAPDQCVHRSFNGEVTVVSIEPHYDFSVDTPCNETICDHVCVPSSHFMPHCLCNELDFYSSDKRICISKSKGEAAELPGIEGHCSSDPCLVGECVTKNTREIVCKCPVGYHGTYCEFSSSETSSGSKVLVGLFILFMLFAIALCVYCWKKPAGFLKIGRGRIHLPFNPTFSRMMEEEPSEPPTPTFLPKNKSKNSGQDKQMGQSSYDSAIVIDTHSRAQPFEGSVNKRYQNVDTISGSSSLSSA